MSRSRSKHPLRGGRGRRRGSYAREIHRLGCVNHRQLRAMRQEAKLATERYREGRAEWA